MILTIIALELGLLIAVLAFVAGWLGELARIGKVMVEEPHPEPQADHPVDAATRIPW